MQDLMRQIDAAKAEAAQAQAAADRAKQAQAAQNAQPAPPTPDAASSGFSNLTAAQQYQLAYGTPGAPIAAAQMPQYKAPEPAPEKKPSDNTELVSFDVQPQAAQSVSASPLTLGGLATQAAPATPEHAEAEDDAAGAKKAEVHPELALATGPRYRIRKGTLIPCTEMLRINGTFASGINCLISIPWYSTDGQKLLIPKYTVALGHTEQVTSGNQQRLFVAFDELIEPDGYTATFQNSSGTDQIGQFGLRDKLDRHLFQVFGTSIALAAVGGLAQIGNFGNSAVLTPSSQYRAGFTQNMSTSAMQVLDRFASVLPTFTIREGARNNVYLPFDLYLPAVNSHNVQEAAK